MGSKKSEKFLNDLFVEIKKQTVTVSDQLRRSLSKKLTEELKKIKRPMFNLRLKAVLATAATVLILFFVFNTKKLNQYKMRYQSTVSHGKPVTVKLVYNAEKDLKKVHFRIELQDGLAFYSGSEKIVKMKTYDWTGDLKKGKNTIPFVVRTFKKGRVKIKAYAAYRDFKYVQEIVLNSKDHIRTTSLSKDSFG